MIKQNSIKITRQHLYKEVWSEPVYKVAMKYGLSDVGLAKICNRNNIPKPPLGYWTKLAHGHKVEKPELPTVKDEQPIEIITIATQIGDEDSELLTKTCGKIDFEKRVENRIVVPDKLVTPHQYTIAAKRELYAGNIGSDNLHYNDDWPEIAVTKPLIPRALLIMDTLIKALEQRGYDMSTFKIFGEPVGLRLHEHLDSIVKDSAKKWMQESGYKTHYSSYDYDHPPSGRLTLSLGARMTGTGLQKNWTDGKTQRIENILNDFICGMIRQAAVSREWRLMWVRWEREREEEKRIQREKEIREAQRQARIDKLYTDAADWDHANLIRRYINAVLEKEGPMEPGSELEKWVAWANAEADQEDPISD